MKQNKLSFNMLETADDPYYLINRAYLSITAGIKKSFASAGLDRVNPAYLAVLMCLWKEESLDDALAKLGTSGGMKTADLARCAGIEPSSMTGVIDRMERDGLVRREDDPDDRRAQKIRLTDTGSDVRNAVIAAADAALGEAFDGVEPAGLEELKSVLRRVLLNTNRGNIE